MDKEQIQEELISFGMSQSPQWPDGLVNDLCDAVVDYFEQEAS